MKVRSNRKYDRELSMLKMYQSGMTLDEIATVIGISRQAVAQSLKRQPDYQPRQPVRRTKEQIMRMLTKSIDSK